MAMANDLKNKAKEMIKSKSLHSAVQVCLYAFACSAAFASELSISLTERVEYSDNIRLDPVVEESDTILNTGIAIGYVNDTQRYPTSLRLAVSYRDYVDNSFDDETNINADIASKWIINPRRFEWELVDRYQLLPTDITAVSNPDNMEDVNYFSTGPNINIGNTRRAKLSLNLRYENFYFEESNEDREDYLGRLNWVYSLSKKTNIGLHGALRSARFKDGVANVDYDRNDYYASLAYNRMTYSASVEAGQTILKRENQPDNDSELIRANVLKKLSPKSTINVGYNRELSDFSTLTARLVGESTIATDVASEIFLLEEAFVAYKSSTSWGGVGFTYTWRDYDYEATISDRISNRTDILIDIVSDSSLSYQMQYAYTDNDWSSLDRKDNERIFLLSAFKKFTNAFTTRLSIQNINNDSSLPVFTHAENRAILDLNYRLK